MNYADRRRNLKANRTGGLTFIDNVLPEAMSLEQIKMIVGLQNQAREPHPSPDAIVIPTRTGEMLSTAEYTMEQRARPVQQNVIAEINAFKDRLRVEKREEVENWDDEVFWGALNGVTYFVPARGRKRLPQTLANHYREKRGLHQKGVEYERNMGVLKGDDEPEQTHIEFGQRVAAYDGMEHDNEQRREVF